MAGVLAILIHVVVEAHCEGLFHKFLGILRKYMKFQGRNSISGIRAEDLPTMQT
jgi:hypothetical protein